MALSYRIEQDEDARDPRADYDHFGTMACWHGRYSLGDVQPSEDPDEYMAEVIKPARGVYLPLYLYDHSGISMSTSRVWPFDCPWDSGQVGWIWASRDAILAEYRVKRLNRKTREQVVALLECEVKEYDAYISGQVLHPNGGEIING